MLNQDWLQQKVNPRKKNLKRCQIVLQKNNNKESILWNMLTLCSFLMVRHTHLWKVCQKQPSQFLVFSELCANWSLCICEVFMITSELADSYECQIYGQSVKYLNQICLPELIHLKKNQPYSSQMPRVMSCHFIGAKENRILSKRNLLTIWRFDI